MVGKPSKPVKFKLNPRKHAAALRYALDHGFDSIGAMARVALYQYMGKHKKTAKNEPKRPEVG